MEILASNAVQMFDPLPKQKAFMWNVFDNPNTRFTWYVGGFGSGKTFIGSHTGVRLAMMAPNGRGLIARQTLVDLKATTMKTFFEVCDPRLIANWNKSENLLTMINGHEIYFWGLDDIEKLKSLEIGWFWFDEVDEVSPDTFTVAIGRLRNKEQPKRLGFITSNSEGKNWTFKRFIKGEGLAKPSDLEKYAVVKAPSNENTHLPEDYLDTLNSYTGDMYKRYVLASFDVFEGMIFPDFTRAVHVIRPFGIPDEWTKIRCMDWGENNPTTCAWLAIDPDGNIYLYREYSVAHEYTPYHVKHINELTGDEKIEYTVMDPSVKGRRGRSGKNIDTEYRELGMPLMMGNNAVSAGIARIHRYLTIDDSRINPITKKKGSPRFFVFDECEIFIDQMETYRFKTRSNDDENPLEEPVKKDDHLLDAFRYGIMSRPDISLGGVIENQRFKAPDRPKNIDELLLKTAMTNNPDDF